MVVLDKIEKAIEDIARGKIVIVVDDEDRENEGDFVLAAEKVTPEAISFLAHRGCGLICTPITNQTAVQLGLWPMVSSNNTRLQTGFTFSIGAAVGTTTGISAFDRARTIKLMTDPTASATDFTKPGHVFPLIAKEGGVLKRPGHTEAAVDLARLAGLHPSGVICEIMNQDGTMARLPALMTLAQEENLSLVSIKDLIAYRRRHEQLVQLTSSTKLPSRYGTFNLLCFQSLVDEQEVALAIIKGTIDTHKPVLTRMHSSCFTGDVLRSYRCDCNAQLEAALEQIAAAEDGILIYLEQEGRGIGLVNKLKSYALQEHGYDTVEANHKLGFGTDERDYAMAAQILKQLGVQHIKLLTNNPQKIENLQQYGIAVVERQGLETVPQEHNIHYLRTKKHKMGQFLQQL